MSKVNIQCFINNYVINSIGKNEEGILSFSDMNDNKYLFDNDKKVLTKDNKECTLCMMFNKETDNITCFLKKETQKISINMVIKSVINKDNMIKIQYTIEDELFEFRLTYREV